MLRQRNLKTEDDTENNQTYGTQGVMIGKRVKCLWCDMKTFYDNLGGFDDHISANGKYKSIQEPCNCWKYIAGILFCVAGEY